MNHRPASERDMDVLGSWLLQLIENERQDDSTNGFANARPFERKPC